MIVLLKNPVEIAGIVISGQNNNIFYRKGGSGQQKGGLIQPFCLQELLKGVPGMFFNDFADSIRGHMELFGNFCQFRSPVIGFDIF